MGKKLMTKPAGCVVQLVGGALAIGGVVKIGYDDPVSGVFMLVIGVVLLWWGRQTG